ncbi:MAG: Type IV fimbriae expression regulatory protein PilR [uncultured Thiotrichaceae bacterium]|uniref:Type IV fimbriae expression regulatory protein PilR n=1 Tax=uncultured Thiotrichaceae bacterium TaxID=298394 RepID=A0A6S6U6T2_9GAMM|nr:MAG: Type IV fimbriae expression regulatory protein PilR [uncultured Thiotrichaceae bacterium]
MTKQRILIVDDEPDIRELLEITLIRMGLSTLTAANVQEALALLETSPPDLCLTDMKLPDGTGLDIVNFVQTHCPETPIAVITAFGSMETAVSALKAGAIDFISKPVELKKLRELIESALASTDHSETKDSLEETPGDSAIIGQSTPILTLKKTIQKISRGHAPVYIFGESGSGKELVAKSIHQSGARAKFPFTPVNCGAIPEALMESEFFGHKKGSFTGAVNDKQGLFEAASGGTLFLDEVADLPLDMQVKLLRAIQEKSIKPVGSNEEISVDVRILSATHKNLEKEVAAGHFRQDLYYRLNVIKIEVPPLRQRGDDIILLAENFLQSITTRWKLKPIPLSATAKAAIKSYTFPGNVRELVNILERAVTLCDEVMIEVEDLQLPTHELAVDTLIEIPIVSPIPIDIPTWNKNVSADEEKKIIESALDAMHWNRTKAADKLGMSLRQLRYRIKKYELENFESDLT